ncbi:carboxypeptidase-like regulatory domain-containing protein [Paludisphaera rhizosphaerae]|uniref:carboxypeptidase-like regulatory domain-containing protein n=1 Tax=Paludisphaera rhizosphaerae TaxID=2711216 RepID=UPI0013EBD6F6|nr:carboxypeptidase-like regulatory domain-containing protein [Paludisphaera rhizosphaerae]
MRKRLRYVALTGTLASAWLGGCGPNDEFLHVGVAGKVTLDGSPLTGAAITFQPLASGAAAHGTVEAGAYSIARSEGPGPGAYRVEISKTAPTGRRIPDSEYSGQTIEETRNAIPSRYNINSELKVDVKPDVDQTFDFDLKSKK